AEDPGPRTSRTAARPAHPPGWRTPPPRAEPTAHGSRACWSRAPPEGWNRHQDHPTPPAPGTPEPVTPVPRTELATASAIAYALGSRQAPGTRRRRPSEPLDSE